MSAPITKSVLDGLDPLLTAPKRLAIMAVLSVTASCDFSFLRDHLDVSDSDLSKQASALEAAGYLRIRKTGRGRGASTTYRATATGHAAYASHRIALRWLLAEDTSGPPHPLA